MNDGRGRVVGELYPGGASGPAIAKTLNVSSSFVYSTLRKLGVSLRPLARNKLNLPISEIVEAYAAGDSVLSIGLRYGVSDGPIRKRLIEAGVSFRERSKETVWKPSDRSVRVIDGGLLGDAGVYWTDDTRSERRTAYFCLEQNIKRAGWVDAVAEALIADGLDVNVSTRWKPGSIVAGRRAKGAFVRRLNTACTRSIAEIRRRWYVGRKKIVPMDLRLTPESVAHWYCGDGWCSGHNLGFCTNCFSKTGVHRLRLRLWHDLGVQARAYHTAGGWVLSVGRRAEQICLRDVIAPFVPSCCQYKFKHIKPAEPPYRPPLVLTQRQADAARGAYSAGLTMAEVAKRFGVSRQTIFNVVHQLYAYGRA